MGRKCCLGVSHAATTTDQRNSNQFFWITARSSNNDVLSPASSCAWRRALLKRWNRQQTNSPAVKFPASKVLLVSAMPLARMGLEKAKRRGVMSMEAFAHRRGDLHALENFRKRQERKIILTAQAKRAHRKLMKQEGFEPGKRVRQTKEADLPKEGVLDRGMAHASEKSGGVEVAPKAPTASMPSKHHKERLVEKAPQNRSACDDRQRRNELEQIRSERIRTRRRRSQVLSQRSRKGQPIMKNIVQDILHRLEMGKEDA